MTHLTRAARKMLALLLVGLGATGALAQSYPNRPVTIIIGLTPGGTLDTVGRILGAHLERKWKQSVIVENRPGGGGSVATSLVTRSAPDGYTLTMGGVWSQSLFVKDLPYDIREITPVSLVALSYSILMVSKAANAKTLAEFVALAKANPGKMNFGAVAGTPNEVEIYEMQNQLGIKGTTVGYKGVAQIFTALVSGELHGGLASGSPLLQSGQILGLAVGGDKRLPGLPELPTFREQGFNYDPVATFSVWARVGTPRDVLEKIAAGAAELANTAEFLERATKPFNIVGVSMPYEATVNYMRNEFERNKRVMERLGMKPQ